MRRKGGRGEERGEKKGKIFVQKKTFVVTLLGVLSTLEE